MAQFLIQNYHYSKSNVKNKSLSLFTVLLVVIRCSYPTAYAFDPMISLPSPCRCALAIPLFIFTDFYLCCHLFEPPQ